MELSPSLPAPTPRALQVAQRLIDHARSFQFLNHNRLICIQCKNYPLQPISQRCGHTRCLSCVNKKPTCLCGTRASVHPNVNILIQDLMSKITLEKRPIRPKRVPNARRGHGPIRNRRRQRVSPLVQKPNNDDDSLTIDISSPAIERRYEVAYRLILNKEYSEAIPHIAIIAAIENSPYEETAKYLLAQLITIISGDQDARLIAPELYKKIRLQFSVRGVESSDLECIICYNLFRQPITTSCGHTFCKICIGRIIELADHSRCPLCAKRLHKISFYVSYETEFIEELLFNYMTTSVSEISEDYLPIFTCTAAFPSIPCPLLMFDPSFWSDLNKTLTSESKQFGMIAGVTEDVYYGTILEIKDCIKFEDGSSIISTIGISRFKVFELNVINGCRLARVQKVVDFVDDVTASDVAAMKEVLEHVMVKAGQWLASLPRSTMCEIESALGPTPKFTLEDYFWETPDGPFWLWWLMALLPLNWQMQVQLLSEQHLLKRAVTIRRILYIMDEVSITPLTSHFVTA